MQITVELPKDIAQRPDPAREALEALAIEGYRSGALSSLETQRLLGFETRYELDGFLKAHNVWEHAYNVEDFNRDCETLQSLEVLIDEAEGRREAERHKVRVAGTLAVLEQGAQRGLIDLPAVIERLRQTNFRLSSNLIQKALDRDAHRKNRNP